jgi:hypothetical protein
MLRDRSRHQYVSAVYYSPVQNPFFLEIYFQKLNSFRIAVAINICEKSLVIECKLSGNTSVFFVVFYKLIARILLLMIIVSLWRTARIELPRRYESTSSFLECGCLARRERFYHFKKKARSLQSMEYK